MKTALALLLLLVIAAPAIAAEPQLDSVERQAVDTWNAYQAHLAKDAIEANAKLEASLAALIGEIEAQKKHQADTDAYWKAWCGNRPGCDTTTPGRK